MNRAIIVELKAIRSRDDLPLHAARLKELFNDLVNIMQRAAEYKKLHPEVEVSVISSKEQSVSEELRFQLNRILRLEGGREVIEQAQKQALEQLRK